MNAPTDWYKDFFHGVTLDLWRDCVPPEQTRSEVEFLVEELIIQPGARILDVPCGNGRHSRALAERGHALTGVDLSDEFLAEARQLFTLVVITNGPAFSQVPKVEAVKLADHVDHIIIGGQEPEQKPARSIFDKALKLAGCEAHEAIHVGDSLAADIAGAHNSNITSVWIQHQQPLDAELGIDPHHTVIHPAEIPALIRRLHPR